MEIKRKFEMLVATKRRFIVHQTSHSKQNNCSECGEPMLTAEQSASVLEITQRRIFQMIETEVIHFNETKNGVVMVCLDSIAKKLSED